MKKIFLPALALLLAANCFAQTKSTGIVTMGGMSAKIDLDLATTTVTYTLTGPSSKWFALGLHASTMSTNTPIDCVSYGTTLLDRYLGGGHSQPTTDATNNLTLVSNTVSGATRTIVATRPFNTGDNKDYTFLSTITTLTVIWAIGPNTSLSSEHSTYGSKIMTFTTVAGTQDFTAANDILLYPVPAKNILNINNKAGLMVNTIAILDINGRMVKQIEINAAAENTAIDINSLESGTYFAEIATEKGKTLKKFEVLK